MAYKIMIENFISGQTWFEYDKFEDVYSAIKAAKELVSDFQTDSCVLSVWKKERGRNPYKIWDNAEM